MIDQATNEQGTGTRALIGWAMFDWANSPVSILIITFVFSVYFSRQIVGDPVQGQALWGYAVGISGLTVAIFSPVLGAIADAAGRRKPWILAFTIAAILGAFMLWFAKPSRDYIVWAMAWSILAKIGFEFGVVFNNAMLPDLAASHRIGRWSGWAWGLGYAGALAALGLALAGFVMADSPAFGLDKTQSQHIRAVGPLVAIWFAFFAIPFFVWTPDRPSNNLTVSTAVRRGLENLSISLRDARGHANILRYLIARMIYADGLTTVFTIGMIYGATIFQMDTKQVLMFGVMINAAAGLGAFVFAWIDDWFGAKPTIIIGLSGVMIAGLVAITTQSTTMFWTAGALLGTFLGPVQSASRSMMARLAPPDLRAQFFGLYAFSGKATAFMGPVAAAFVTQITNSQKAGLATAILFIAVGLGLLITVRPHGESQLPADN